MFRREKNYQLRVVTAILFALFGSSITLYLLSLEAKESFEEHPVVLTRVGRLRGLPVDARDKGHVYAFLGVPFGHHTGGSRRFQV